MKNTQYYVCASIYVGPDEQEQLNGSSVSITTRPWFTEKDLASIYSDWSAEQEGPFATLPEAQKYMQTKYGDCRPIDKDWAEPDILPDIVECYAIGAYEQLTKEDTRTWLYDGLEDLVSADTTDPQLEKTADEVLATMQADFNMSSTYILEILEEYRDCLRTEEGWWDDASEAH